jgi:hypothetical protein
VKIQVRVFKAIVICEGSVIVEGQALIVGHASADHRDLDVVAIEVGGLVLESGYFYCVES